MYMSNIFRRPELLIIIKKPLQNAEVLERRETN